MEAEKVSGWEAVCKLALTTVANNNRSNGIRKHNVAKNRSKQSKNQIMDWIFIVKCSPLVTCQFCEQFELENMINATFPRKSSRPENLMGSAQYVQYQARGHWSFNVIWQLERKSEEKTITEGSSIATHSKAKWVGLDGWTNPT